MVAVPLVCEYAGKVLVQNALALGDNVSSNVCIARLRGNPHFRFGPLFKWDRQGLCPVCVHWLCPVCALMFQYHNMLLRHGSMPACRFCVSIRAMPVSQLPLPAV